MKKLFEVEVKYYVMAESPSKATSVHIHPDECTTDAQEAESVDSEWWSSLPYGGDDGRSCGQILTDQKNAGRS